MAITSYALALQGTYDVHVALLEAASQGFILFLLYMRKALDLTLLQ